MKINESLWQSHENLWNLRKSWWNYENLLWTRGGRMYQTSVRFLTHSTTFWQSIKMSSADTFDHSDETLRKSIKIYWKSMKINESVVVECIRLPSDFWYIRPRFENLLKWARLIHSTTLMKLYENPSKYNGNLWKSTVN